MSTGSAAQSKQKKTYQGELPVGKNVDNLALAPMTSLVKKEGVVGHFSREEPCTRAMGAGTILGGTACKLGRRTFNLALVLLPRCLLSRRHVAELAEEGLALLDGESNGADTITEDRNVEGKRISVKHGCETEV